MKGIICEYGSGMLCDPRFVEEVTGDILGLFGYKELENPDIEFDVHYGGEFAVSVTKADSLVVITVRPVVCIGNDYVTVDTVDCGTVEIAHTRWTRWLRNVRHNQCIEYRQADGDKAVVYLTCDDEGFTVGVKAIRPQPNATDIELELVTLTFEGSEEAYLCYDDLISAMTHLYRGIKEDKL